MKSAILQIHYPKKNSEGYISHEQSKALSDISRIAKDSCLHVKGFEQLGEYAWLCQLETSLHILSGLVHLADKVDLSYRVAFLDDELQWMNYNDQP